MKTESTEMQLAVDAAHAAGVRFTSDPDDAFARKVLERAALDWAVECAPSLPDLESDEYDRLMMRMAEAFLQGVREATTRLGGCSRTGGTGHA